MRKVFILKPGEDWIIDRFVKEWSEDNADITVQDPKDADVIWLLADFCWTRVPIKFLATKRVITTIHHIVPEKFGPAEQHDFAMRDGFTHAYHVTNKYTEAFIRPLTKKPIHVISYWANKKIWHPTDTKAALRKKHGLPADGYLIGSFQRDTEGSDLVSPKMEKGPDLLANYLDGHMVQSGLTPSTLHVVLAGWRRQYIINRLKTSKIPYTYIEKPAQEVINELYQTLDLYVVSARVEGGPQALVECGLLNVPCISRPMGIAEQVLPDSAINEHLAVATPAVPKVERFQLPAGYEEYRKLIETV